MLKREIIHQDTHAWEERHVDMKTEIRVMFLWPKTPKIPALGPPKARRGAWSEGLSASEEVNLPDTWLLDFWPPEV